VHVQYSFDEHKLKLEDIKRLNKQKWVYAQRLCSQIVQSCFGKMRKATNIHHHENVSDSDLSQDMLLQKICTKRIL